MTSFSLKGHPTMFRSILCIYIGLSMSLNNYSSNKIVLVSKIKALVFKFLLLWKSMYRLNCFYTHTHIYLHAHILTNTYKQSITHPYVCVCLCVCVCVMQACLCARARVCACGGMCLQTIILDCYRHKRLFELVDGWARKAKSSSQQPKMSISSIYAYVINSSLLVNFQFVNCEPIKAVATLIEAVRKVIYLLKSAPPGPRIFKSGGARAQSATWRRRPCKKHIQLIGPI